MSDDTTPKIFKLRYTGERYKHNGLPLDMLSDLPAFRDLMVAFAKDEWKKVHPDKERVPRGFDKSLSFELSSIEEGSAVPNIVWNRDGLTLVPDEMEVLLTDSFSQVVRLFEEAGKGYFPKSLPVEHIKALNRFGSGLKEGERIEFLGTEDTDGNVVFLDANRRKELITHAKETYQMRVEVVGILKGNDISTPSTCIKVETEDYNLISVPLDAESIRLYYDGQLDADIQLDILIELDNRDRYRNVIEVFNVALLDAEETTPLSEPNTESFSACLHRLNELEVLQHGWLDGEGYPVSQKAIEQSRTLIQKRPSLSDLYRIFPTETGGILFEFEVSGWDLSVEFDVEGKPELYGIELNGDAEIAPKHFETLNQDFFTFFDERTRVSEK